MASIAKDHPSFPELASILPDADRTMILSGLSDTEMRSWTMAKIEEYRHCLRALVAIHNLVAPVHRLPDELLSHIFTYAWHERQSLRLGHICRRWRRVLLDTPKFWVDAVQGECLHAAGEFRDPPGYIAAVLERSGRLPIRLSVFHYTETLSLSMKPHLWRITVLLVHAETTDEIEELHRTLSEGLPVLTMLLVRYNPERCLCDHRDAVGHCERSTPRMYLDPLPAHSLPRLRHVELPAFFFSQVARPSLRQVRLDRVDSVLEGDHENPRVYIKDLMSALAGCQELVALELINTLPPRNDHFNLEPRQSRSVSFPVLRRLQVEDRADQIMELMQCIVFPPTAYIHIRNTGIRGCLRECLPLELLEAAVSGVDQVSVSMYSAVLRLNADGKRRLDINTMMESEDLRLMADLLPSKAAVTALAWASRYLRCGEKLLLLLRALGPPLKSLSLSMSHVDIEEALNALRPSDDLHADGVLCPHLERLTLGFWSSDSPEWEDTAEVPEEVARIVAARCARIHSVLGLRASRLGTQLTHLEFYECLQPAEGRGFQRHFYEEKDGVETLRVVMPGKSSTFWTSMNPSLQALEELVDGSVIFSGFRKQIPIAHPW
ncbi:hypothetical protein OH76DRAFT_1557823 [Lentinus brumalis]|uniref:F-box domain-containing protein n=1 Tax=Lentinus brumalis TaxID=2498619 RepID=A0A371D4F2_9APHY|nr:hypothetical protein OH76DRAFT_1557823 [Polyporus brumalis]